MCILIMLVFFVCFFLSSMTIQASQFSFCVCMCLSRLGMLIFYFLGGRWKYGTHTCMAAPLLSAMHKYLSMMN